MKNDIFDGGLTLNHVATLHKMIKEIQDIELQATVQWLDSQIEMIKAAMTDNNKAYISVLLKYMISFSL